MKRFPRVSVLDLWCIVWTVNEHMRIVARRSDAVIVAPSRIHGIG